MWYKFHQNNSGGYWKTDADKGVGVDVWIEAPNPVMANAQAEYIGIYFEGCSKGRDCYCCGDRWDRVEDYDEITDEDFPESVEGHFEYHSEELGFIHPLNKPFYKVEKDE